MDTYKASSLTSKHYTHNTGKHPLLCYIVPQAMPSFPILFRVCKEDNQPSRLVYKVPSHTRFIKQVHTPFPFPKSIHMSNEDVHTVISILEIKNITEGKGNTCTQ